MIALAILLVLFAAGCAIRLLYRAETSHDELHYAETPDGVRLALYRYKPAGGGGALSPVILCHGFSSNRFTWELPGMSMARFLAGRGHDVWSLELRGAGRSKRMKDIFLVSSRLYKSRPFHMGR